LNIDYFFPQTGHEWRITLYFFLALLAVLGSTETVSRIFKLPKEFSRKSIHVAVGLLVVFFSFYLVKPQPLIFLCLIFSIVNFFVKRYNLVPSMQSKRQTYGTIFYPLAILVAIFLFWDQYRYIFINVVLIMALADAFAAVTGQAVKKPITYKVWQDKKSLQGSIVFFLISYLIIIFSYHFPGLLTNAHSNISIYFIALVVSLVVTLAESISSKGSDNFSITLVAGFFLFIFLYGDINYQQQFFEAVIFSFLIALVSIRLHFLKIDGAVSTALLAVFIYGIGGWQWTIPVLTFFITSSVLSKLGRRKKHHFRLFFEKSSKRDAKQVFANGGVALVITVLYFFLQMDLLFDLYIISLAAANADTWATELGVFNKSKPRMITTFLKVEKGSSGAISTIGTFAAFLGSLVVVLSGMIFIDFTSLTLILLLSFYGFAATFIDSLLGATFQAQYQGPNEIITEKAFDEDGHPNMLIGGFRWLNNDMVNFISIFFAPLVYLAVNIFI
jgi:uncharacterized protein (TIGR00297 family)